MDDGQLTIEEKKLSAFLGNLLLHGFCLRKIYRLWFLCFIFKIFYILKVLVKKTGDNYNNLYLDGGCYER